MKLALLTILLAVAAYAQQPCQDWEQGCYDWANNVASSNCKAQGGCTSAEWDYWYDTTWNTCQLSQPPYCATIKYGPTPKPRPIPKTRKTAAVDFVWNSAQHTQDALLALLKKEETQRFQ
jgi:hypothetical protein